MTSVQAGQPALEHLDLSVCSHIGPRVRWCGELTLWSGLQSQGYKYVLPSTERDVRFGSQADIEACLRDVRFTPKSGH